MKVTFYYDKFLHPRFDGVNCTFEFITESYHQFLAATKDSNTAAKKEVKITFEK